MLRKKNKTESLYKADSCAHHDFMRLISWKSCGMMGVIISLGGSNRNWQDSDNEKQ